MNQYKKVIIWGYPLYSHTHSYIHEGYYRAFKFLNFDTYWFDDNNYPIDFDYNNCLFVTEGFADKNIPLNNSSCYAVMYCPSPIKYQGVKQYIDVRMAATNFEDHIQKYSLDKNKTINVGPCCYFEPKTNHDIHIKNNYVDYIMSDFDKFYIAWATNLLPHEINFDSIYFPRKQIINYCGSIDSNGICENYSNFKPFIEECVKNNIPFIHNCPWNNPISNEEVIKRTQESLLGIDIRGPEHIKNRLLNCRVYKNISYGHLGLTNSEEMMLSLDGNCIYNNNTAQLFYDGINNIKKYELIKNGMKLVKEKHTFINRIKSLLEIIQ